MDKDFRLGLTLHIEVTVLISLSKYCRYRQFHKPAISQVEVQMHEEQTKQTKRAAPTYTIGKAIYLFDGQR